MANNNQNKILLIIIFSTIFGFSSGIVGFIFARAYLYEKIFNLPLIGSEINFSNSDLNRSSLIFRDAKKVVVEQNVKVVETINTGKESIVGIFNMPVNVKNETDGNENNRFNINDYNLKNKASGQGFILTSDGWILTNYLPDKLLTVMEASKSTTTDEVLSALNNYRIFTKDKKMYIPDEIIYDKVTGYSFWHIKAKDLPVKKFVDESEINIGQLLVAVNWEGWSWLSTVEATINTDEGIVLSSDEYQSRIILTQKLDKEFYNSFLFNLDGGLAALINNEGDVVPTSNFLICIECLLKDKEIDRAFLGVNYIDLNNLVSYKNSEEFDKGALIYKNEKGQAVIKGSPADKAGLEEGDIILSVDNTQIINGFNLSSIINKYSAGDEINIKYLRSGIEKDISLILGKK